MNGQDPEHKREDLTAEERKALEEDYYKGDYSEPYAPGWILRQRAAHPELSRDEHKALEAAGDTAPAEWYIEEVSLSGHVALPNIWTPSTRTGPELAVPKIARQWTKRPSFRLCASTPAR